MALNFLKDRDENAVMGNLGAFTGGGARGQSIQTALAVYRKDQKTHHEQSIASDLTRGLLRKVFRDTVLESSKQVKRKYSYSAVGSTVQEDIDAANMGIMAKLKKMQKERLIVARLGFPDKAMEIDEHIETIRADLRNEREKEDSRILEEALASLVVRHSAKLSALDLALKEDENKVKSAFERERATLLAKQEKQFVQLVDNAIKRAIGKSKSCSCAKKYLCHHNKTASFNTRRPKKEVIHFRKNAKRLRHGGRLDESAAWEEKAAELDADHLDNWREEVAASLTASAWGGSSSPLDQLAAQHQREVNRMETAQANEWTLMLMRHRTARRNCDNAIMVEQKKLRVACKKSAEERHRREMLGEADPTESGAAGSNGSDEDVAGMLRAAIDDEDSTTEDKREEQHQDEPSNGMAATRPPTRPSSAPPARGKRPQPNTNNESNQQTPVPSAVALAAAEGDATNHDKDVAGVDDDSFGKDSHDLEGFDELEGEVAMAFSYDSYPAAGSPEEPEWFHTPWCGTNSGDIPILDKVFEKATTVDGKSAGGNSTKVRKIVGSQRPRLEGQHSDGGDGEPGVALQLLPVARGAAGETGLEAALSPISFETGEENGEEGRGDGRGSPRRVSSPRIIAGGEELKRYDWGGADVVPGKPSLLATSRVPTGNRADKRRFMDAKRKDNVKKTISWGQNMEVPPESDDDEDGTDNGKEASAEGGGQVSGTNNAVASNLDAIADGFVDDDSLKSDDDDDDNYKDDVNKCRRSKGNGVIGQKEEMLKYLEEPLDGSDAASKRIAARASCTGEKALARETSREKGDVLEGGHGNANNESVVHTKNDDRPEEREMFDVDNVPASKKKRRVSSEEEEPSTADEESLPQEMSGSAQTCTEEHPLQRALDQFYLILALHGDWMSLLGHIFGHDLCRKALHRWISEHHWREHIEACFSADVARGADGRVLSWGSARARAAAETMACSAILAPFIASPVAWHMVHSSSSAGRKAIGGRIIAEEPALARSKRPWRTLFERVFGSLQYGAVLSVAETSGSSIGREETGNSEGEGEVAAAAAAGKVLWANEGFEQLAGVDAVDIVGQEICSLFEEGEDGEGEERGELKRSLELGKTCMLWMMMAGQQEGSVTDVLCLHQTVAVPPQLSDEGRYSVLMFFDTASVLFESPEQGGGAWGERVEVKGGGPMMPPDREEGEDTRQRRSRRRACSDLSKAMVILLSDGDTEVESGASVRRESDNPFGGRNKSSRNSRVFGGTRAFEGQSAEREARDKHDGAQGKGNPGRRSWTLERPSSPRLNRESDARSRDLQGELDGELLEARLAHECGILNELRGDCFKDLQLSDVPKTRGDGGQGEEEGMEEEKHAVTRDKEQHHQHVQPTSPPRSAVENDAAEYSSNDESSAPPRVDLLLSPYRPSTSKRSEISAEEQQTARETTRSPYWDSSNDGTTVDETLVTTSRMTPATDSGVADYRINHEEAESIAAKGNNRDEHLLQLKKTMQGTVDRGKSTANNVMDDDEAQPSTPRKLRLSLDGYEDDFCDDEDEPASAAQPEAEREGSTGKSSDTAVNNDNEFEGMVYRSGGNGGGVANGFLHGEDDDYMTDGYGSSNSDGVHSGTVAGGLETDLNGGRSDGVGYGSDGIVDDTWWRGSPEESEEDLWGIRSPPRSTASNRQILLPPHGRSRKVSDSDANHPLVSGETDRWGG